MQQARCSRGSFVGTTVHLGLILPPIVIARDADRCKHLQARSEQLPLLTCNMAVDSARITLADQEM